MANKTKAKKKAADKFLRCNPKTAAKIYKIAEMWYNRYPEKYKALGFKKPSVKIALEEFVRVHEEMMGDN